ncbi:MAG: ferrous iron transport protein A [Erysipelotrichaceae bacterium]|nr:ferrous iron transport protein A [Erysipelotrichaceae bacterium]MDD3809763.1 ferrous iron transport protein A [Erysipelotrichaceae bacterium]
MENSFKFTGLFKRRRRHHCNHGRKNNCGHGRGNSLIHAELNQEYTIKKIRADNDKIGNFLFSLGCFPGSKVTVVSKIANQYVIVIKNARYSIDKELAWCIVVD